MRIGSLVRYNGVTVNNGLLGVITKRTLQNSCRWTIHWVNGEIYQEHEMHLEVLCK